MERLDLDAGYRAGRGFHGYACDPAADRFTNLSASGGSAVPHGNVVPLTSDLVRNIVYGAVVPTGVIYRYDVASGRIRDISRPALYRQPYVYAGRMM